MAWTGNCRPSLAETVATWAMFIALPIERILVVSGGSFTVRPAYPFMAVLIVLNARSLVQAGVAGMISAAILLAVALSALTTESPLLTAGYAMWALFAVFFFVSSVGRLRESRERVASWTRIYVATAGLWGLFAISQSLLSLQFGDLAYSSIGPLPRVSGLAYEPSFFAFYLIPPLLLSFGTAKYWWTAATLMGVLVTTSRTGLLGLVVGLVVLMVLAKGEVVKKVTIAIGACLAAVGLAAVMSRGAYSDFLTNIASRHEAASITPRLQSWSDAWTVFTANPLDGVGTGAFGAGLHEQGIALGVPASDLKTTNMWLEIAAEMGIVGLMALLAWVAIAVVGVWRRRRRDPLAPFVLAALLASAFMFAFVQTWWVPYRWIVWIIAYSIAFPRLAIAEEAFCSARPPPIDDPRRNVMPHGEVRAAGSRAKGMSHKA